MKNLMIRRARVIVVPKVKPSKLQVLVNILLTILKTAISVTVILGAIYLLGILARILVLPVSILILAYVAKQIFTSDKK